MKRSHVFGRKRGLNWALLTHAQAAMGRQFCIQIIKYINMS